MTDLKKLRDLYDMMIPEIAEYERLAVEAEKSASNSKKAIRRAKRYRRIVEMHNAMPELMETLENTSAELLELQERSARWFNLRDASEFRAVWKAMNTSPPEVIRQLRARLSTLKELVEEQANDAGLWFDAETAPEAYVQRELRRLHSAVEDDHD